MNGLAFSSMRVGKKYRMVNYGEIIEFILEEVISSDDYLLREIYSMESYKLSELIRYGRGEDFELREIY